LLTPEGSRFGHFVSKWSHSMADLLGRVNIWNSFQCIRDPRIQDNAINPVG
jgi:hypothetical protein